MRLLEALAGGLDSRPALRWSLRPLRFSIFKPAIRQIIPRNSAVCAEETCGDRFADCIVGSYPRISRPRMRAQHSNCGPHALRLLVVTLATLVTSGCMRCHGMGKPGMLCCDDLPAKWVGPNCEKVEGRAGLHEV